MNLQHEEEPLMKPSDNLETVGPPIPASCVTPLSSSPSSQPSPHTKDDSKCLPSSIIIDLIFGNDAETQVFAHAHDTNSSSSLTFRITQDAARPPQNFANRIVARFHDLSVSSSGETFPDRESMRKALGDAIRRAWPGCVYAAAIPYAVVDLYVGDVEEIELEEADVKWRMRHETVLYQKHLDALLPVDDFFPSKHDTSEQAIKHIDIGEVVLIHRLPGRGTSALSEFIFNRDSFYNSVKVTSTMAPHPNIQPNPQMVLTSNTEVEPCFLYPFMAQGTLDTQVTAAQEQGRRLRLQDKARWALQMSRAVLHTHHVAKTYHMDIKPANFLIDDHGNAILIDWEQSGAPLYTLAPEANGEWDVAEVTDGDVSHLVYTKYKGPKRENLPGGRPAWNVFPEWSRRWPKACEVAEVFSLGRTMWMLLQQVPQEDVDHLDAADLHVDWDEASADIPNAWKAIVMQCLTDDPLARMELANLVKFWEQQQDIVE